MTRKRKSRLPVKTRLPSGPDVPKGVDLFRVMAVFFGSEGHSFVGPARGNHLFEARKFARDFSVKNSATLDHVEVLGPTDVVESIFQNGKMVRAGQWRIKLNVGIKGRVLS